MINKQSLEKVLGFSILNEELFDVAFTHRSFLNENRTVALEHNERMEFLGDAVLELVVTEYLYKNYQESEGILTNWRSALVNGKMLSSIATELDFEPLLKMSKGEAKSIEKSRRYILANAFEAFIGAIYLDSGYENVKKFIGDNLITKLDQIIKEELYIDSKSKLQEIMQEKHSITPVYQLVSESGPDHNKEFICAVYVGQKKLAEGIGSSKQRAEQNAALNALELIHR